MTTPARPVRATSDDLALAVALAAGAGDVLLLLREAHIGSGGTPLKEAGDAAAQAWLAASLATARPDDRVLSEEAVDDPRRLEADRVWIIDPLDGTREFAERDEAAPGGWRSDFAVHVALWQRGVGLTAAAVGLPARGVVHDTGSAVAPEASAYAGVLDGTRALRVAVSRSRPPAIVALLAADPGVELVPMGSAGVKTVSVLDGTADAYVHAGGQYEWDSAAPVAVVQAAGFVATRLDGSPLAYNRPDPYLPDLLVCHPVLHDHLRTLLEHAAARESADA